MDGVRSETGMTPARISPRERSERIARSLSEAARRLRFSGSRAVYSPAGRKARRHKLISRLILIGGFIGFVALPGIVATVYFGFLASRQYEAEARFTVRSGAMAGLDALTSLTGIPSIQIVQDTQVVTSFIGSRAMVEHLQQAAGFNEAYMTKDADFFARLARGDTIEEIVRYWRHMVSSKIQLPGGTVILSLRAFRSEDAVRLANAVLDASESLVNDMNERARLDSIRNATSDLQFAASRLAKARAALEIARNREGILDADAERAKADALLTALRQRLIDLQQQYKSTVGTVSETAPQMRTLKANIEVTQKQIVEVQAGLTRAGAEPGKSPILSASMTRLAMLELENQVAEQHYATAATALEGVRSASLTKQIYLTTYVRPTLADDSAYPRRGLSILVVFLAGAGLWAVFCGISVAIRGYF